jgi:cytochrome c556
MRQIITFAGILFLSATSIATADVISERKAGFKGNAAAMKAIQAAIPSGDMEAISSSALKIADWSAQMTEYFPEGSGTGDTDARPEIWSNFDDFTNKAKSAENAARELASLAQSGHKDQLAGGVKKLGETCKTCHSSYKKK